VLRADFSNGLEWVAGGELLAGVPAKSGGSFLHLKVGKPASGRQADPSRRGADAVALVVELAASVRAPERSAGER